MGKSHVYTQNLQGNALFFGKIYTVGNIFTRPSVVTVATNFKCASNSSFPSHSYLHVKVSEVWHFQFFFKIIFLPFCCYVMKNHHQTVFSSHSDDISPGRDMSPDRGENIVITKIATVTKMLIMMMIMIYI